MKINCIKYFIILAWILLAGLSGCKKQDTLPTVTTDEITEFGATYAISGWKVIDNGGSDLIMAGLCIDTLQKQIPSKVFSYDTIQWSGRIYLAPAKTHFVRAYATNAVGTAYGNQIIITTPADIPAVTSWAVLTTASTSAISGGLISYEGGSVVTARGVCWSTSHNPAITDNKTTDSIGKGSFISTITGLAPNTTYYFRAYAANSAGTGYGVEYPFVLEHFNGPTATDIDGNVYHSVTIGTQVWMVENLRTTRYTNGDYCGYFNYNNDPNYSIIYGGLYNYPTKNDSRKIAPVGWHIPSSAEVTTLTDWLTSNGYGYGGSGSDIAKSMASKSGWWPNSTPGNVGNDPLSNNSSGFTALPGGAYRQEYGYSGFTYIFDYFNSSGFWWCSDLNHSYYIQSWSNYIINTVGGGTALSVRCIKD